jgi:hypothetical protein
LWRSVGVEGALEQGAEDGGLDVAPVVAGGVDEELICSALSGMGLMSLNRPPLKRRILALSTPL